MAEQEARRGPKQVTETGQADDVVVFLMFPTLAMLGLLAAGWLSSDGRMPMGEDMSRLELIGWVLIVEGFVLLVLNGVVSLMLSNARRNRPRHLADWSLRMHIALPRSRAASLAVVYFCLLLMFAGAMRLSLVEPSAFDAVFAGVMAVLGAWCCWKSYGLAMEASGEAAAFIVDEQGVFMGGRNGFSIPWTKIVDIRHAYVRRGDERFQVLEAIVEGQPGELSPRSTPWWSSDYDFRYGTAGIRLFLLMGAELGRRDLFDQSVLKRWASARDRMQQQGIAGAYHRKLPSYLKIDDD